MATIVYFSDGQLEYPNPKTARAKLRKMGLTVRDAKKQGQDYHFDCEKPDGAVSLPVRIHPEFRRLSMPCADVGDLSPLPKPEIISRPLLQNIVRGQQGSEDIGEPVKGKDIKALEAILNFIPGVHLTVDPRGVHTIVHEAENITRQRNEYLGFYSMESGSMSSFKIDPERTYEVIR